MAIPIYGIGTINVTKNYISYVITFDYFDENKEYYNLVRKETQKKNEEEKLKTEMQKQINGEKTIINGNYVFPVVKYAKIGFKIPKISYVNFYIEMPINLIIGKNTYENIYEETTAKYDYIVTWILPKCGKFVKIDSPGNYEFENNYAFLLVSKGTKISGYESLVFEIKEKCF
ncbi:MAG: hypothetical protein C0172_01825 [Caldisphaera sp.]|uniref:hypothetical protein n=1 Tax=Caldisphaera sp. TaxID=2060322 RepID=UPI000CC9E790|nr:MAG: hypothetical protein C0172_01825 [Caldisphaera sp.]